MTFGLFILVQSVSAQADDICREFGETPSREAGRDNRLVPFVYGRIVLKGLGSNAKLPRVTVIYSDSVQPAIRQLISRSGNYCFQKRGTGAMIIIDVDGTEAARRSFSDISNLRQREDLDIYPPPTTQSAPPGVVSTKFTRPPNEKTRELYTKAAEAERDTQPDKAIEHVKEIVSIDAQDFIAWTKLGSLYASANSLKEAEAAFNKALDLRADYPPVLINFGMLRAFQNQFEAAIPLFQRAIVAEPASAIAHRLLGESYLQVRKGTLGLKALNESLRLDPVGMAECHLLIARLYDLAGAKHLATREYKIFLTKITDHPDKKKFEKYITDNPEKSP